MIGFIISFILALPGRDSAIVSEFSSEVHAVCSERGIELFHGFYDRRELEQVLGASW